jgi:hypothetical protein
MYVFLSNIGFQWRVHVNSKLISGAIAWSIVGMITGRKSEDTETNVPIFFSENPTFSFLSYHSDEGDTTGNA